MGVYPKESPWNRSKSPRVIPQVQAGAAIVQDAAWDMPNPEGLGPAVWAKLDTFWRALNGRKRWRVISGLRRRRGAAFWRGGLGLAEQRADGGFGDVMLPRQLAEAESLFSVAQEGSEVDFHLQTAETATFQLRPAHAGANSFDNQRSFQVGHHADDGEHGFGLPDDVLKKVYRETALSAFKQARSTASRVLKNPVF